MAPQKPPCGEDQTLDGAMHFQGLFGVLRTCRQKTTTREQEWRNKELVSPNHKYQDVTHGVFILPCI